jgi:hypothetical protein
MAFQLYKPLNDATQELVTMKATAAIAVGDVVKMAAGVSGDTTGRVAKITGGQGDSDAVFGVACSAASSAGDSILIQKVQGGPNEVWLADAAADTDITKASLATTYIDTSMKVAVGGTITNKGNKVIIAGVLGAAADRKYLVYFVRSNCLG